MKQLIQMMSLAVVFMFVHGCHFGEERLQIPKGTRIFPAEIPTSVMSSNEVQSLPEDIQIERFGDDSNGLWRFIYPDGTEKHRDQNGKNVVVHGGII